jgi:NAD(P)-dependent dehydrogenase (short-subunit alcohol dehydrogenase family)
LRILITGATDGLGRALAEHYERDHDVLVHGRDPAKAEYVADLSSLDNVRSLAEEVGEVDVLVNNAGIISHERQESVDGYELVFAVNYLSHFLLTGLVRPPYTVNVASAGQTGIDFDDVMLENGYDLYRAYAQSKLAQVMFTFDMAEKGFRANCLHPATFMDTKMVRESFGHPTSSVEEGMRATARLVELEGVSGRYFNGTREGRADDQAYDPEARRRLWSLSEELTGLRWP